MHETEGVNFKVGAGPERESSRKIGPPSGLRYNNPNLGDILSFIEGLPVTKKEKEALAKSAKSIPHGALFNFRKNYVNYLRKEGRR